MFAVLWLIGDVFLARENCFMLQMLARLGPLAPATLFWLRVASVDADVRFRVKRAVNAIEGLCRFLVNSLNATFEQKVSACLRRPTSALRESMP
jgi:hypothetical protein